MVPEPGLEPQQPPASPTGEPLPSAPPAATSQPTPEIGPTSLLGEAAPGPYLGWDQFPEIEHPEGGQLPDAGQYRDAWEYSEVGQYPSSGEHFATGEYQPPWPGWDQGVPPAGAAAVPGHWSAPSQVAPDYVRSRDMVAAPKLEPLPVERREYHQFYRAPAFRWWKPLVAVSAFAAVELLIMVILSFGMVIIQIGSDGRWPMTTSQLNPELVFATNNIGIAIGLPIAFLASWVVYRQRPRWLSSVAGGFRWRAFWRFGLVAAPIMAAALAVEMVLGDGFAGLQIGPNTWWTLAIILATTPFQAAAEEYSIRGLLARSVGSWFRNRWVGLVVATVVTSVAFMLLHGAGDPWLNSYYLLVGVLFSVLVWRTGGLEAAVMMHIVNNVISEITLPFTESGFDNIFDRVAGVAGPETLIQMGVTTLVAGLLLWQASRLGLSRAAAPAAEVR